MLAVIRTHAHVAVGKTVKHCRNSCSNMVLVLGLLQDCRASLLRDGAPDKAHMAVRRSSPDSGIYATSSCTWLQTLAVRNSKSQRHVLRVPSGEAQLRC